MIAPAVVARRAVKNSCQSLYIVEEWMSTMNVLSGKERMRLRIKLNSHVSSSFMELLPFPACLRWHLAVGLFMFENVIQNSKQVLLYFFSWHTAIKRQSCRRGDCLIIKLVGSWYFFSGLQLHYYVVQRSLAYGCVLNVDVSYAA